MINISPTRWDEGINVLTINYDFSGSHTLRSDYGSQETDTSYLNLRNGRILDRGGYVITVL